MDNTRKEYKAKWDRLNKERVKEYNKKYRNHEVGKWVKNKPVKFVPETEQEKRQFQRFKEIFGRNPKSFYELNELIKWFKNAHEAKIVKNKELIEVN
mgnify:CR=1 FL=1